MNVAQTPRAFRALIAHDPKDMPWLATPPECCEKCGAAEAAWYRMNCAYLDERLNWAGLCVLCQAEVDKEWTEMWEEYYRSVR